MTYVAKINNKNFTNGKLEISVVYSEGIPATEFAETYQVGSQEDIDNKIKNRLVQLESLNTLYSSIVTSATTEYVPKVKLETLDPLIDAKIKVDVAYDNLQKGIIEQVEYDAIVADYKTLNDAIGTEVKPQ